MTPSPGSRSRHARAAPSAPTAWSGRWGSASATTSTGSSAAPNPGSAAPLAVSARGRRCRYEAPQPDRCDPHHRGHLALPGVRWGRPGPRGRVDPGPDPVLRRRTTSGRGDDIVGQGGGSGREKSTLENRLTFLVAVIIAGVCAQGIGRFFYDKLGFPLALVIIVGGVLELTAFTCALRARRNIRESDDHRAGVDGIAVWVVTALSGSFSAMDADGPEVAIFRLVMPLLAAWLWERGMSIERRKARGGSTIQLRLAPERVLVWLRIAEPSGRTTSDVDAHRRLTRVAKAAAKVRALRRDGAGDRRLDRAQRRLDRAMRAAVTHAGLATDPDRQQALIAQLGSMYNADVLADLNPQAPWEGFTSLVQRSGFAVQGRKFTPMEFTSRPPQFRDEVQDPVQPDTRQQVQAPIRAEVHEPGKRVHELADTSPNQHTASPAHERTLTVPMRRSPDWSACTSGRAGPPNSATAGTSRSSPPRSRSGTGRSSKPGTR